MIDSQPEIVDYDVCVAGGGMVGSVLACGLAQQGFKVALVERREPEREWPVEDVDLRVSALTRASQRVLDNLGVWQRMASMRVSPYRAMEVWDAGGFGGIRFEAADLGEPDLGHIVENRVTRLALWECMEQFENLQLLCPDEPVQLTLESSAGPQLALSSGCRVRARLVVGAEGARSPVREMAGISSSGWSYDQQAIVATIRTSLDHDQVARQRFMPDGPLALLPVDQRRCSIVWSTSPAEAARLLHLSAADFCQELSRASERVLGEVLEVGPRASFPLSLRNADRYVQPGLALVGDAAHGVHPLAGQGVNLGILDAAVLVDVLGAARKAGRDLGATATLRRYERARKGADIAMLGVMDLFKRLFSNSNIPLTLVRNLGLNLVNLAAPAKHLVVRRAMGLTGELPWLARKRV